MKNFVRNNKGRYSLVSLVLMCNMYPVFSQNPVAAGMKDNSLWIKGVDEKSNSEYSKKQQNNYFNFNPLFENVGADLVWRLSRIGAGA